MPQTVVVTGDQVRVVTVGVQGPPGSPGPAGPQGPPGGSPDLSPYARTDQANTFTQPQTVNGTVTATAFVGDGGGLTDLPPPQLPDNLAYTDQANVFAQPQTVVGEGENEPTTEVGGGFVNITNGSNGGGISGSGGSWSGANVSIEVQKIPGGNSTVVTPDHIATQGTITAGGFVAGGNSDNPPGAGQELVLAPASGGTTGILFQHNGVSSTYVKSDGGNLRLGNNSGDRVVVGYASPAHVSLTVQGTTGQTADLIQCQTSTGNLLAKVTTLGTVVCPNPEGSGAEVRLGSAYGQPGTYSTGQNNVIGESGAALRMVGGPVLALNGGGVQYLASGTTAPFRVYSRDVTSTDPVVDVISPDASATYFSVGHDGRTQITPASAGKVPLSVQGAAGQTADLQRWGGRTAVAANGDPILSSPDGTRYRLLVSNDGSLSTAPA